MLADYRASMRRAAASIVSILATSGLGFAPAGPSAPVDVVPVLTSTPFAAAPGRAVAHTVTLSGTGSGTVPGVRVTFTTTVALDGATASPSRGTCPVVTALTVVCELGDVTFTGDDPVPAVRVTGTVHPGTPPGTLVQNLVTVAPSVPDADPANNSVSNAYLVAGMATAPVVSASPAAVTRRGTRPPWALAVMVLAALVLAGLLAGAVLLLRTRRARG
jgi:hypothetical protein